LPEKPLLVLFAGPNGSGKTTLYYDKFASRSLRGIEYVNPDEYNARLGGEATGSRETIRRRKELIANKSSFVTETTLTGNSALRLLKTAKTAGYRTVLIFVSTASPGVNMARVRERVIFGGHDVPRTIIERRYHKSIQNLPYAILIVNNAHVFASDSMTRRIFSAINGSVRPRQGVQLPQWVPARLAAEINQRGGKTH